MILVFTSIYAASGGLKAVMYTDVGQATVFLLGGAVGAIYALNEIGGTSSRPFRSIFEAQVAWRGWRRCWRGTI